MVESMVPSFTSSSVGCVHVHRHQQGPVGADALEGLTHIFARSRFEANDRVNLRGPGAREVVARLVHGQAGIPLHVENFDHLDAGIVGEDILIPLQPLLQIGLAGDGEEDNVALAVQLRGHARSAQASRLQIVGADEVEPMALRRVRVDRDHRNPGRNCRVDFGLHQLLVGNRDQDACGIQRDHLAETRPPRPAGRSHPGRACRP